MINKILFLLVLFLANVVQCITGFAGSVLSMPFSIILVGYSTAKPIINAVTIVASAGVLITRWKKVNRIEFFKMGGIMLIGVLSSGFITPHLAGKTGLMNKILGVLVILFAVINVIKYYTHKEANEPPKIVSLFLLLFAGVVHGVFVCGGPILVDYALGKLKDKDEFRATMSAVWILTNTVILFQDVNAGYFNKDLLILLSISVGVLVLAIALGNLLAKKMSRDLFLKISYLLMAISGISLLID